MRIKPCDCVTRTFKYSCPSQIDATHCPRHCQVCPEYPNVIPDIRLYVDDIRKAPNGWITARTVNEAVRIVATQNVVEVSLDYDISYRLGFEDVYRPFPSPETFEAVAWYLAAARFPGKVSIHTANPAGAEVMKNILHNAEIEAVIAMLDPCNGLEPSGQF